MRCGGKDLRSRACRRLRGVIRWWAVWYGRRAWDGCLVARVPCRERAGVTVAEGFGRGVPALGKYTTTRRRRCAS